jgi:hypothetical protein
MLTNNLRGIFFYLRMSTIADRKVKEVGLVQYWYCQPQLFRFKA